MLYHEFPATVNHLSMLEFVALPFFQHFTVCLLPWGWQREKGKVSDQQWWSDKLYQEASAGGLGPILKAHNNESDPMIRWWWCHRRHDLWLDSWLAVWLIAAIAACKKGSGADVSRKIVISLMIWLAFFLISISIVSCLFFTTQHFVITCFFNTW